MLNFELMSQKITCHCKNINDQLMTWISQIINGHAVKPVA